MRLLYSFLLFFACFVSALSVGVLPIPNEHATNIKAKFDDYAEHYLLPEDFHNAETAPVKKPTDAEIESMQNSLLFEGDIMGVPEIEKSDILKRLRDDPLIDDDEIFRKPFKKNILQFHSALNLVTYPDKLWPEGQVPYMLEEGMTNDQRTAIAQAFDEYKTKTCVRFVPKTDDDFDYIYVKRNVAFGCSSYVGRAGGNQTVSLEVDKCFSKGIIAHELMHALGFFHEHSRTDRDDFVDINEDNIRPGMMRNFEKYPRKIIDSLGMPYDYESVMHYHKLAFSRNGKPTIVPKDNEADVGQRYKLSEMDSKKVNKLYQCGEYSKTSSTTTTTTTTTTSTTTTTEEPTTTTKEVEENSKNKKTSSTTTTTKKPTTTPSTTTTTTTPKPVERSRNKKCEDLNAHCGMWEQLGHCQHSVKYMAHYCRKACGLCEVEVTTTTTTTAKPLPRGKEKENKSSTSSSATSSTPRTTVTTTTQPKEKCEDKNLFCSYWAKIGECNSESKFMKIFCKASCGKC
ncbi:CRE-NAS-14 protein [Caenorhabditis remanei]|uniref:Metalloendopeptidase n=1 Tax=Caenorhabditis remanei TaxID=31234 RepID=E3M6C1_CAERE|nr:CRE-NAS-14 protein [Caenorhabditis remanei]